MANKNTVSVRTLLLTLLSSVLSVYILYPALPISLPGYKIVGLVCSFGILFASLYGYAAGQKSLTETMKWMGIYYFSVVFTVYLIYGIAKVVVITDEQGIVSLLQGNLSAARWIYFFLCFFQPIALPIPEAVTVIAGSSVFGTFQAFIIGFVGTLLGVAADACPHAYNLIR